MKKIMIMSLGGSPEPLKKSLAEHQPDIVIFFASHDSIIKSGEIFKDLATKPKIETEITENPNSLYECYVTAKRCVARAAKHEMPEQDIIVDYTGGTKVMSAALLLATAGHDFGFNYVGGDARSKDGLGVVQNGHEKMYADISPWSVFAEEERRQIVTLFNARRYGAVIQIIDNYRRGLPSQIESYFKFVRHLSIGFLFWDQFQHKRALDCLKKGVEALDQHQKYYPSDHYDQLKNELLQHIEYLTRLLEKTNQMKNFDVILVKDLINNARRRIQDKSYDDAAARIYRALELYGQICFEKAMDCTNDKVKPTKIPQPLHDEFIRKYRDPQTNLMKLPLHATFEVLKTMGHEAGKRFFDILENIKNIQSTRNKSILAHGIQPVTEHAAQSIMETVTDFVQMKEYFDFPVLRE